MTASTQLNRSSPRPNKPRMGFGPGDGFFSDSRQLEGGLRIWRLWIPTWVIVVPAILVALGICLTPARRAYGEYQINQSLMAAHAAAQLDEWGAVRNQAGTVLLARPGDLAANRLWTRALGKLDDPRAGAAAADLFNAPRATREDRLEALRMLALKGPQAQALAAYASLPDDWRAQALFRAALTPLLVQRGGGAIAEQRLRDVIQPTDPAWVHLELLRTLCSSPRPDQVAEARRIFANLISSNSTAEALTALSLLGDVAGGLAPGDPLPDLPKWLNRQPQADTSHHLLGMEPALAARPEAAPALYESAIARFLASDPARLGNWLTRHHQAATSARVLEHPATTRPDAYLARLNAMLSLGQTDSVKVALNTPPPGTDPVDIEIAHASLDWLCENPAAAEVALARATTRAALDTGHNRFIEIARLAERHGDGSAAENAWVAAIRLGWGPLPPYDDLVPVFESLAAKSRTQDMLMMYRSLLRLEPNHPVLADHFNYLALLHGVLPPQEVVTAQTKLVEDHPENPAFNATLVVAEMLAGNAPGALARLPLLRDSISVTPVMNSALEGTVRLLAGDTATGTALLRDVNWNLFMRQERIVLRGLLASLKNPSIAMP